MTAPGIDLKEIIGLSRLYGSRRNYVLAGGGNTSVKDADTLHVKASGHTLDGIGPEGFVALSRRALDGILAKTYSQEAPARESQVKDDLAASVLDPALNKAPSVESLLHHLIEAKLVVHTHPTLVNGLTCSQKGSLWAARLLPTALWLPYYDPGYTLAKAAQSAIDSYRRRNGSEPKIILLENHGLFLSGETGEEIIHAGEQVEQIVAAAANYYPDPESTTPVSGRVDYMSLILRKAMSECEFGNSVYIEFRTNKEILRQTAAADSFRMCGPDLTPDHIVYCGSNAMYFQPDFPHKADGKTDGGFIQSRLVEALLSFRREHGDSNDSFPRIIGWAGLGFFACGQSVKAARTAADFFNDAIGIACYSESFGGPHLLASEHVRFIESWEAEHRRKKMYLQ